MAHSSAVRLLVAAAVLLACAPGFSAGETDGSREGEARSRMVKILEERYGIGDETVLHAMERTPRHLFVPPSQRRRAYEDHPLPIGFGQTISQPFIVAYMTHIVGIEKNSRVLEIGSGSGYQAAVLAEITDNVYSIEIVPELAFRARENLRAAGYTTVRTRQADGYHGWPEAAPFDAIVVTAAAPHIPPPLLNQLKDGGRMVIPLGSPFLTQQLVLVEKNGDDLRTRNLMAVRFVPLTRLTEP